MASFNNVMLMGNLTRDPELRYTSNNTAIAKISLACNRKYSAANGEKREEVTFVDCEAWGRTGEVINQYLSKGRPIFIEGRLKLDQWTDQNGQKRSRHVVVIENFQFIDSRGSDGGGGGGGGSHQQQPQSDSYAAAPGGDAPSGGGAGGGGSHQAIDEDDIPF